MASVQLKNVSKTFSGGGKPAVNSINLDIKDREFLVLVGPSGCGKSTTLRMIAGLEHATSGEIYIGDQMVNQTAPKDRDIAMVFQNYALYPHMTVYRNMAFGLQLRYGGWLKRLWLRITDSPLSAEYSRRHKSIAKRVKDAAETLGISHLLDRMPGQLSGGERQRVALGRAIVRQPAAFLFDEPLSNLDARLRGEMRRELKRLHQDLQTTMIYVTHDQVEAMTLGDRIVVMNHGEIQQAGPPLEVYNQPANRFTASFTGSPAMNFLEGELQKTDGSLTFKGDGTEFLLPRQLEQSLNQPVVAGPVSCGVRPEHVSLGAKGDEMLRVGTSQVVAIEPLGESVIIYVQNKEEEQPLAVRAAAGSVPATGEKVELYFDASQIHFFDKPAGKSLRSA